MDGVKKCKHGRNFCCECHMAHEALKPENQRIYPVGTTRDYESELAALREELEMARDDLVIFKGAISALGEASKKLVVCARTTGGTAGPDSGLMDACAGVENVITLGGIARAMNELEQLIAERDELSARLEQARDRKNSIVDLQQRLTAAEQRNAILTDLLRKSALAVDDMADVFEGRNDFRSMEAMEQLSEMIADALKPTESGASE